MSLIYIVDFNFNKKFKNIKHFMQGGLNMIVAHRKANFLLWEDSLPLSLQRRCLHANLDGRTAAS